MERIYLIESYQNVKKWCRKLEYSLQRLSGLLDALEQIEEEVPLDLVQVDAEHAYISAIRIAENMQGICEIRKENRVGEIETVDADGQEIVFPEVKFHAALGAISCKILSPPTTKANTVRTAYLGLICRELQKKVIENLPDDFVRMPAVNVIYINHFLKSSGKKQPYFDNDNLAIKGILDSIIPLICYDDAFTFCNNFYVAQPDVQNFAEVVVLPQGHLLQWIESRPELDFAKEFGSINGR